MYLGNFMYVTYNEKYFIAWNCVPEIIEFKQTKNQMFEFQLLVSCSLLSTVEIFKVALAQIFYTCLIRRSL